MNAVLTVLAMLILPQIIVVGWSAMERDIAGKLQWSARATAKEAADELAKALKEPVDESLSPLDRRAALERRLEPIALEHTARIRIVKKSGVELADVDRDQATDLVHQIGMLFFGPDGAPTLREVDELLGPVPPRAEVLAVTHWDVAGPPPPPAFESHYASIASSSVDPPRDPEVATGCRAAPGGKLVVCHAARAVRGGENDIVVVYVQESSRRAVRALYDLRYHLLRLSLIMLPMALAFSWWMGKRMVRPIEWLRARVLEKVESRNPRADLASPQGDEVADLAEAFNDLLGALDERRRANEAFVADLVHEFKNPVAAIRACAESLAAGGVDETRAARLAKILDGSSARLDALVSQFLELARAEAGMPNEARTPVDVLLHARGVVSTIEPRHPEVAFSVEGDEGLVVHGVEARLDSLVRNLVDNAASFAKHTVRVTVSREGDNVIVEVCDDGPGIAEKDIDRVFDRFFTTRAVSGDAAAGRRTAGTGLGLALVKAIAEAHGGSVSATSAKGATFRVTLPASSASG